MRVGTEIHLNDDGTRKLRELEFDLWSGTNEGLEWECCLKGIPTKNGRAPDYCGGNSAHRRRSHTNAKNTIVAANGDSPWVVAFSLKSCLRQKHWRSDLVRKVVHEKTALDDATVGHYACDWHDAEVFALIDDLERVKRDLSNSMVPVTFAARAILMQYFLALRRWRLFDERSRFCMAAAESVVRASGNCTCREEWLRAGEEDRRTAEQHWQEVYRLRRERNRLVSMMKARDGSRIAGSLMFLPGTPSVGGTMGFHQRLGNGLTCTIIPAIDGHYVYITHHRGLVNLAASMAIDFVVHRLNDARKGQFLSELALQQHMAVFITTPKWRSLRAGGQQDAVREVVEEMRSSSPRLIWSLRGDGRVPNLFL